MTTAEKVLIVLGLAVVALYAFRYTQTLDAEARAHLGEVANDNAIGGATESLVKGGLKLI